MIALPMAMSLIIGYLLGSIMFAKLIANNKRVNIEKCGSGNAGSTNVLRRFGWKWGLMCLVGDAAKGAASVGFGKLAGFVFCRLAGEGSMSSARLMILCSYCAFLGAILGHLLPLYHHFRGGKCVATALGGFLAIAPVQLLIALAIAIVLIAITKTVSVGSVVGTIVTAGLVIYANWGDYPLMVLAVIITAVVVIAHLPNIQRLLSGNERKLQKIAWVEKNAADNPEHSEICESSGK